MISAKSKYKLNVLSLFFYKGTQISSTIILTAILLDSFGVEDYAVYILVLAMGQFVLIDTGASESVKKALISGSGKERALNVVHSGFFLVSISSFIIIIMCSVLFFILNKESIYNDIAIAFFTLLISLSIMPLKMSREIFTAFNETYKHSIILTLCIFLATFYALFFGVNNIFEALLIQHGVLLLGNLLAMFYLFHDKKYFFHKKYINKKTIQTLMPDTVSFMIIGFSLMFLNGFDLLLLSALGADNHLITELSLVMRVFIYIHTIFMFLIYPSWPILSQIYKKDLDSYNKIVKFSIVFGGLIAFSFFFVILLFIDILIEFWVNVEISVSLSVCIAIALFHYFRLLSDFLDYQLRVKGYVTIQAKLTFFEAISHVLSGVLGWYFFGVDGFFWGAILPSLIIRLIPYLYIVFLKERFRVFKSET